MSAAEFPNTAKALLGYERTRAARESAWRQTQTEADINAAEAADLAAARLVQEAFYEDTKHLNSLEDCLRIHVIDLQRLVRR